MSLCVSDFATCPAIQDNLEAAFTQVNPSTITEPIMFTELLLSDANRDGVLQEQTAPGNGKKRDVELIYSPRIPEDNVKDNQARVCSSTCDIGDRTATFTIDEDGVAFDWRVDITDLATRCEDDGLWLAKKIAQVMNGLLRKLELKNITQAAALFGNFDLNEDNVDVNDVKTVRTQLAGNPSIDFISEIAFASMNMAYPSNPIVVGWDEISKAFTKLKATCCADNGLDIAELARQEGIAFMNSKKIRDVLPANNFFTMALGSLQLLWYNEFMGPKGLRVSNDDSYIQGILVHPRLGLPFDYILSNNCGVVSFQLKLATKVVGMPADMFCAGDTLDGVTYVNEYAIDNT